MTLDEVKQHLRVEGSEDDALITSEMAAAESYIKDAVSNYATLYAPLYAGDAGFKAKADMVMLAIVTNLYEDRVGEKKDLGYIIQSMLHQLSLWEG